MALMTTMPIRQCKTCRYWDAHSTDLRKGDCKVPGDHRYTHGTIAGGANGNRISFILDSFGPEETLPSFSCGRWDSGDSEPIEEFPE